MGGEAVRTGETPPVGTTTQSPEPVVPAVELHWHQPEQALAEEAERKIDEKQRSRWLVCRLQIAVGKDYSLEAWGNCSQVWHARKDQAGIDPTSHQQNCPSPCLNLQSRHRFEAFHSLSEELISADSE